MKNYKGYVINAIVALLLIIGVGVAFKPTSQQSVVGGLSERGWFEKRPHGNGGQIILPGRNKSRRDFSESVSNF